MALPTLTLQRPNLVMHFYTHQYIYINTLKYFLCADSLQVSLMSDLVSKAAQAQMGRVTAVLKNKTNKKLPAVPLIFLLHNKSVEFVFTSF